MRRNLSPTDLGSLLELPILAILATRSKKDEILLSPVWHEWSNEGFSVITWAQDVKSRQLSANPHCSMVVAEQIRPFRSIEVRGFASVQKPADAYRILRRIASRYLGVEEGNAYVKEYETNDVEIELIRLEPGVLRAWDFSDENILDRLETI